MCFSSSPRASAPPPLPAPIPEPAKLMDATQVEARNKSDAAVRTMRGSQSTVVNPLGAQDTAGVGTTKVLLGM